MNIDVAGEAAFIHTHMPVLATGSQTLHKAGLPSVALVPMFSFYRTALFKNLLHLKETERIFFYTPNFLYPELCIGNNKTT